MPSKSLHEALRAPDTGQGTLLSNKDSSSSSEHHYSLPLIKPESLNHGMDQCMRMELINC